MIIQMLHYTVDIAPSASSLFFRRSFSPVFNGLETSDRGRRRIQGSNQPCDFTRGSTEIFIVAVRFRLCLARSQINGTSCYQKILLPLACFFLLLLSNQFQRGWSPFKPSLRGVLIIRNTARTAINRSVLTGSESSSREIKRSRKKQVHRLSSFASASCRVAIWVA